MEGEQSTARLEGPSAEQSVQQAQDRWYTPLTRVTTLSRILALALFVALPFVGFWLGVEQGVAGQTHVTPLTMTTETSVSKVDTSGVEAAFSSSTLNMLGKMSVYRQSEAMELLPELLNTPFFTSESSNESEYKISCQYVSDYVRSVTGACTGDEQAEVVYDEDCTECMSSNIAFKSNKWNKDAVLLADAENERLALVQAIHIMFGIIINTRRGYGESGESASYAERPTRLQGEFDASEDVWLAERERTCRIVKDSIPPEASGTNGLYEFEYISCLQYVTQQRADYLRKIASWLSGAEELPKG